jgi:hypothetical protein
MTDSLILLSLIKTPLSILSSVRAFDHLDVRTGKFLPNLLKSTEPLADAVADVV